MGRTSFWTRSVAGTDYGPCRPSDLNWAPPYTGPRRAPCPAFPAVVPPPGADPVRSSLVRYSGAVVRTGFGGPVVAAVQRALGVSADGAFGPGTAAAVSAFRARKGLGARAVVDAPTWRALLSAPPVRPVPAPRPAPPAGRRPAHPELLQWKGTVLRVGARGPAVLALQKRLGVRPTAYFGPLTRAAVLRFQQARKLPRTGVVARPTWAALIR
jgi:peptidoglycan hydrolase-like protein with peptidoglycan-binding domain